jgi:hypothetical protein
VPATPPRATRPASRNCWHSSLVIKVNERPIKKSLRLVNEPVLEVHAFVVGDNEKSDVRIEKERKPLVGCKNRLYVNNRLVKVFSGL